MEGYALMECSICDSHDSHPNPNDPLEFVPIEPHCHIIESPNDYRIFRYKIILIDISDVAYKSWGFARTRKGAERKARRAVRTAHRERYRNKRELVGVV